MNRWSSSLFKGRIGEALVEAVLLEFGYKVVRSGYEYQKNDNKINDYYLQSSPDLIVIDPTTRNKTPVEVKLRTGRPMFVILEKVKLDRIRKYHPSTILAFVSAYDGSINCASLNDLALKDRNLDSKGYYALNLFEECWKPIWYYFPLVKQGDRLAKLWAAIKNTMNNFSMSKIFSSNTVESFEDEREALLKYIEDNWDVHMLQVDILNTELDKLTLAQLWDRVLAISAFLLALDILGEENIETIEFHRIMDKLTGNTGEHYLAIDLEEIKASLHDYPDLIKQFNVLINSAYDSSDRTKGFDYFRQIAEMLPTGVGRFLLIPEYGKMEDAIEVDAHTAIMITLHRNRLDS